MVRGVPRDEILQLADRHGVVNVRVFGSVARDHPTEDSDLDLLVNMAPGRSLFDLVAFSQAVEDRLGHAVEVITESEVSPHLRERIIGEAIPL